MNFIPMALVRVGLAKSLKEAQEFCTMCGEWREEYRGRPLAFAKDIARVVSLTLWHPMPDEVAVPLATDVGKDGNG